MHPDDLADQHLVNPSELAKFGECTRRLEHRLVHRIGPQFLGQRVGIFPIALLTATADHSRDDDLLDVSGQGLVEPRALGPFLEDQVTVSRHGPHGLDQGRSVGLYREVPKPLAGLGDDGQRAAGCMGGRDG